jgi:hypothetical protein
MGLLFQNWKTLKDDVVQATSGRLFKRHWWYRSWTVLDSARVLTRPGACFHYGFIVIQWEAMEPILSAFFRPKGGVDWKYSHINHYLRSRNSHRNDPLRRLMIDFGHSQATDPRDKIYAFLSVAKDGHEIVPDYTASVQEVYTKVAKVYISKEHNLELVRTHHRGYSHTELPSWVPDWPISRVTRRNWTVDLDGKSLFNAGYSYNPSSAGTLLSPLVEGIEFGGMDILKASGVILSSIVDLADTIDLRLYETSDWIEKVRL